MRTPVSTFELIEPRSLPHALALMRDSQPIVPLAGCTDVYVALNAGTPPGTRYLNLLSLDALRGIARRDGVEYGFHGCFHDVGEEHIVQTFTFDGQPDDVALETLRTELHRRRSRLTRLLERLAYPFRHWF